MQGIPNHHQPALNDPEVECSIDSRTRDTYRVTALVSIFRARRFIKGCLDDLLAQSMYQRGELEILVIDSASPQGEWEIIKNYAEVHPHILGVRTSMREGLYQAWNRGILLGTGLYLTNANADDRHRRDSFDVMAKVLDENPEIALVYGDS